MRKSTPGVSRRSRDLPCAAVILEMLRAAPKTHLTSGRQKFRSVQEKSTPSFVRHPQERRALHGRDRSQLSRSSPPAERSALLVLDRHTRRLQEVQDVTSTQPGGERIRCEPKTSRLIVGRFATMRLIRKESKQKETKIAERFLEPKVFVSFAVFCKKAFSLDRETRTRHPTSQGARELDRKPFERLCVKPI